MVEKDILRETLLPTKRRLFYLSGIVIPDLNVKFYLVVDVDIQKVIPPRQLREFQARTVGSIEVIVVPIVAVGVRRGQVQILRVARPEDADAVGVFVLGLLVPLVKHHVTDRVHHRLAFRLDDGIVHRLLDLIGCVVQVLMQRITVETQGVAVGNVVLCPVARQAGGESCRPVVHCGEQVSYTSQVHHRDCAVGQVLRHQDGQRLGRHVGIILQGAQDQVIPEALPPHVVLRGDHVLRMALPHRLHLDRLRFAGVVGNDVHRAQRSAVQDPGDLVRVQRTGCGAISSPDIHGRVVGGRIRPTWSARGATPRSVPTG